MSTLPSDWIVDLGGLETIRRLGRGSFATIDLVRDRETSETFALRTLNAVDGTEKRFIREVASLITLNHACVVALEAIELPTEATRARLLMEFMPTGSPKECLDQLQRARSRALGRTRRRRLSFWG